MPDAIPAKIVVLSVAQDFLDLVLRDQTLRRKQPDVQRNRVAGRDFGVGEQPPVRSANGDGILDLLVIKRPFRRVGNAVRLAVRCEVIAKGIEMRLSRSVRPDDDIPVGTSCPHFGQL